MLPEAAAVACSPRIARLRDERENDHDRSQIPHRDKVYRREFAKHPDDCAALRFAYGFEAFLAEKKIHLKPHDLLAGFAYRYSYNTTLPALMPEDYDPLFRPEYDIDNVREAQEAKELAGLKDGDVGAATLDMFPRAVMVWLYKHW